MWRANDWQVSKGLVIHRGYQRAFLLKRIGSLELVDAHGSRNIRHVVLEAWRHNFVIPARRFSDESVNYNGQPYRSLSMIAREITSSRWSGPAFLDSGTTPQRAQTNDAA
jgi:hypothetical protein